MKKLTFVWLFCVGIITCAYSQNKQELIKELFQLMEADSASTQMFNSMMPAFFGQNMQQEMDSTARIKKQQVIGAVMEEVKKIIVAVKEEKMKLYDKYFTEKEIKQMIAFYKSPAGQKYVSTNPEITKELVMKVMQEYVPAMKESMKKKFEGQNK